MGKVGVVKIKDGLKGSLDKTLDLIGGVRKYVSPGDKVMLKPNLNGEECCTNVKLTESLIELLFDNGVKNLFMAESTFGNAGMTNLYFKKTGYADLAQKHKIRLINLNESEPVKLKVRNPLILNEIKIAGDALDADKIINIPVMKVHYATAVTLALKNLKGLLSPDEKIHFHEVGLDKAIVDLNNTVKIHLNILDCIECMERMGPRGGDIVKMNLIISGGNAVEVDYVGSHIMGYNLDEVKHLKYFMDANRIDTGNIEVYGERIDRVKRRFKKARLETMIPRNIRIHNINACSACMNALILSCRFIEPEIKKKIGVFLGSKTEPVDKMDELTVAFGNCCVYDKSDIKIKGCPPYPFTLKEKLKKIFNLF